MEWRLIDSGVSAPEYTVAADEAISIARSEASVPDTIHLYRRDRPTVSIGYFQQVEKAVDLGFCRDNGIHIVRRITGGSAIYTDEGHLIFALAVGEGILPSSREGAFEMSCSAIVAALRGMGIEAEYKPVNDVLVCGRKISGSAQTRRAGAALIHGTLIMRNNPYMMARALRMDVEKIRARGFEPSNYVTSLSEVLEREPDPEHVKRMLVSGFESVFGMKARPDRLKDHESSLIKELIESKYGLDEWNLRM